MKKFFALLAAAMMLASCAMAEDTTVYNATYDFDVTMVVPEGYTMSEDRVNENLYINIAPDDETAVGYWIAIGYSEEYDERSIGDLTDEELDQIVTAVKDGFANPVVSDYATEAGTRVYLVDEDETATESDWALAYTVYRGYFISVQIERPEYATLTEADFELAIKLLSDMQFVDR